MRGRISTQTLHERFWAKVDRTPTCWLWTASTKGTGYGAIRIGSLVRFAHRLAWEMRYGAIPDGMQVLHRCDNTRCVRPDHLYLGTVRENMRDREAAGHTRYGRLAGTDHPNAKLTAEQIQAIRASSEGPTILATRYQVSKATIWNVRTRRHYQHLS